MAYLQKNWSKGSSLLVCLFLQGLDLSGKGAILPLNKSLFDCFNWNSNSKRRISCCCFDMEFHGYLRIVLRLWIGHGQNGAKAGKEYNCNGLFEAKSEQGIEFTKDKYY